MRFAEYGLIDAASTPRTAGDTPSRAPSELDRMLRNVLNTSPEDTVPLDSAERAGSGAPPASGPNRATGQVVEQIASRSDTISLVIGHTGAGKSTLLEKAKLGRTRILAEERRLVVNIDFGTITPTENVTRDCFIPFVHAAQELVNDECRVKLSDKEFYDFVRKSRPELVTRPTAGSRALEPTKALSEGERNHPFDINTEYLKCVLVRLGTDQPCKRIEQVVLVVDNIETLPAFQQKEIVLDTFRLFESLKFRPDPFAEVQQERKYTLHFFIACRPHTGRFLRADPNLAAYVFSPEIVIDDPRDLDVSFRRKVLKGLADHAREDGEGALNRHESPIKELIGSDTQAGPLTRSVDLLLDLANHDYTRALALMRDVLLVPEFRERGAKAEPEDLIGALSYGERGIYSRHSSTVFNLFGNRHDITMDLFHAMLLSHMHYRTRVEDNDHFPFRVALLEGELGDLLGHADFDTRLNRSLRHLGAQGLVEVDTIDEAGRHDQVVLLTPKGRRLFELMSQSRTLVEVFAADTYIPVEYLKELLDEHDQPLPRLRDEKGGVKPFKQWSSVDREILCLCLIKFVAKRELRFYLNARSLGVINPYLSTVGTEMLARRLYKGLYRRSIPSDDAATERALLEKRDTAHSEVEKILEKIEEFKADKAHRLGQPAGYPEDERAGEEPSAPDTTASIAAVASDEESAVHRWAIRVAVALSLLLVGGTFVLGVWPNLVCMGRDDPGCAFGLPRPLTLNEFGDFVGGVLTPLSLLWFVWTLFLQRGELRQQRKELQAQRLAHEQQLFQLRRPNQAQALEEALRSICIRNGRLVYDPSMDASTFLKLEIEVERQLDDAALRNEIKLDEAWPHFARIYEEWEKDCRKYDEPMPQRFSYIYRYIKHDKPCPSGDGATAYS